MSYQTLDTCVWATNALTDPDLIYAFVKDNVLKDKERANLGGQPPAKLTYMAMTSTTSTTPTEQRPFDPQRDLLFARGRHRLLCRYAHRHRDALGAGQRRLAGR